MVSRSNAETDEATSRSSSASASSATGWNARPRAVEQDAERTAVVRVTLPRDEPCSLGGTDDRGHGLLREAGARGDLSHPQPVLLEEGKQDRAERGAHFAEAARLEPLAEQLVPAL